MPGNGEDVDFYTDVESKGYEPDTVSYDDNIIYEGTDYEKSNDNNELVYILSLYSMPNHNRSNILQIFHSTQTLLKLNQFKDQSFENLDSEYKIINILKRRNIWIDPKSIIFDYKETQTTVDGVVHTCEHVSIAAQLQV